MATTTPPAPTRPEPTGPDEGRAPRVVTVLAGLGVATLLLGLLAVVSPAVREQLALTLTRQDTAYVETYFTDADLARGCTPGRPRFAADVTVANPDDEAAAVAWTLRLVPVRGGRTVERSGTVTVLAGAEQVVRVAARKPPRGFVAEVGFPGRDQRLLVRCTGERR